MFKPSSILLVTLAFLMLAVVGCQSTPLPGTEIQTAGGSYRRVSVDELKTMLANKDFVLVNVHIPWQGDIPQTDLRLAYDTIAQNLDQLPAEKDAKILVYCLTSGMAKETITTLQAQGYTDLWMLNGGTTAWEEAGLILEK